MFKKLTAFFIVVALLLVALHSVAHDVTSVAAQGVCARQTVTADYSVDDSGQRSDQCPVNNAGGCCDSEECGQDVTAPPVACNVKVNSSVKQLVPTDILSHIPTVYLAIFVPPER